MRDDRDVALKAMASNGVAFHGASVRLRADPEIVLAALESHPELADDLGRVARGGVQWDEGVRAKLRGIRAAR